MQVVLYSTNCPKCIVLERKLKQKNISFEINNNPDAIRALGYLTAPLLSVDEKVMDFVEANNWVNSQEGVN